MSLFSKILSNTNARTAKGQAGSVALYVGGLVVLLAGVFAVAYQMAEARFTVFTVTLTLLGVVTSYQIRRRLGAPRRWIEIGAVGVFVVFLYTLRGVPPFEALLPAEARVSPDMQLACAIAIAAAFASFLLVTDDTILFTCVFPIASIGLTGTVNVNRELILCFLVFLTAAVFLLVHQNYLHNKPLGNRGGVDGRRLVRAQIATAFLCSLTAVVIGLAIAIPLQMVGRNLSLAGIIRRLTVPAAAIAPGLAAPRGTLNFNDSRRFEVGLGPVPDDQTRVLTVELVQGEKTFLWRGRTFEVYTGTGWETRMDRERLDPDQEALDGDNVFNLPTQGRRGSTKRYVHRFRPQNGVYFPLYAAAEPQVVRAPLRQIVHKLDNTLSAPRGSFGMGSMGPYTVESAVSEPSDRQLHDSGSRYPPAVSRDYGLSGNNNPAANPALAELAQQATQGFRDPFGKAEAIRRFVAETCVYTLDAPAIPRDPGVDAVEYFLTQTKTGYCDLYASAVAVLCRYAGLPARVATGFVPGNPSPDNPREIVLRNADRHAWAEVYFPGYGWMPFDATALTTTLPAAQRQGPNSALARLRAFISNQPLAVALCGLGFLALLYVAKTEVWDRWAPRRGAPAAKSPADQVAAIYKKTVQFVAGWGVIRGAAMTPGAYVAQVRAYLGDEVGDALRSLTLLTEQALYGPGTANEATIEQARRTSQAVRAALRRTERKPRGQQAKAA